MATDRHPDYQVDEQPMLALRRARRAWELTQPQLSFDLDGLGEGVKRAAADTASPVAAAAPSPSPSNPRRMPHPRVRSSVGRRAHLRDRQEWNHAG